MTSMAKMLIARGAMRACKCATQEIRPRPSRIIAEQREVIAQQEGLIELLKGALAAAGSQDDIPAYHPWMEGLTPQERALLGALFRAYPRPLDKDVLLDLLPGQDHVADRQSRLVAVKVCKVRKKLGGAAIEHASGLGYRLGREQWAAMRQPRPPAAMETAGGG